MYSWNNIVEMQNIELHPNTMDLIIHYDWHLI